MSLPKSLAERTLRRITETYALTEAPGLEGGPHMTLRSQMSPSPVGTVRLFRGGPLQKVVAVSLVVPPIGLDSHMVFAFTKAESPIPHFTIDSVGTGAFYAFHLDLIPRADLAAYLPYMNATLFPLTAAFEAALKIPGLTPAMLSPRQRALMSPWMLAHRADEAAFAAVDGPVTAYLDHWMHLVDKGISPEATLEISKAALAERDRLNRAALFNPETDPVWLQVDRLLGADVSARIRDLLKAQS